MPREAVIVQNKDAPEPSKSQNVTETVNGSHHFTIRGYSLAKGMGIGKFIASEPFDVGGHKWAIYFYPDGKNPEDNAQYVSVFIALAGDGHDVRALFELTLMDQSGQGEHKVHSHFERFLESGPYSLKYKGSMWGYKRFFRRTSLEASDYLVNDTLVFACTVGVIKSSTIGPKVFTIDVPPPDIGVHFGELLESGEGADVSFEVDGEAFKAHKLILAARSPVFKALLCGPLSVNTSENIPIKDMHAPIFKTMLKFIYSDCLSEDTPELSATMSSEVDNSATVWSQHLLAAADRYALHRLRVLCESKLCKEITVDTVAFTLALAEQHRAEELKKHCLSFAAGKLKEVMDTDGYKYMSQNFPTLQEELLRTVASNVIEMDEESRVRAAPEPAEPVAEPENFEAGQGSGGEGERVVRQRL